MERLIALLFFLLLSRLAAGATPSETCPKDLAHLVDRMPIQHQVLIDQLRTRITDPLILEFEIEHLIYLRRGEGHSAKNWKVFNPIWIFDDAALREQLLEYFDPQDGSAPRYAEGIEKWIITWEKLYENHLGELSYPWTKNKNIGRRKFIQRFLLEAAVRYALREGGGSQPGYFTTQSDRPLRVQVLAAEIDRHFLGGMDEFQRGFDVLYRQQVRSRVPTTDFPEYEKDLRLALRAIGVDVSRIRNWRPRVRAHYRQRRAAQDLELAVESIRAFGDSQLPLAGLFLAGSEGAPDSQAVSIWSQAYEVTERHGGVSKFLDKVNRELQAEGLTPLVPGPGTRSVAQELVVELAIFQLTQTDKLEDFDGFQAERSSEPYYVDMDNLFLRSSGLTLFRLNQIVRSRLKK